MDELLFQKKKKKRVKERLYRVWSWVSLFDIITANMVDFQLRIFLPGGGGGGELRTIYSFIHSFIASVILPRCLLLRHCHSVGSPPSVCGSQFASSLLLFLLCNPLRATLLFSHYLFTASSSAAALSLSLSLPSWSAGASLRRFVISSFLYLNFLWAFILRRWHLSSRFPFLTRFRWVLQLHSECWQFPSWSI